MKKRFIINIILVVISALSLLSVYVSPEQVWVFGFFALSIPLLLLLNGIFVLYWLKKKHHKKLIWSLAILVLSWSQFNRTFSLDASDEAEHESIGVLSANVRVFNVYKHLKKSDPESSEKLVKWLESNPNDILCLQEYYNEKDHITYATAKRLKKQYPHQYIKPVVVNRIGAQFGVGIFSKYKIIQEGRIPFKDKSKNQAIFADILWNNDTVRVYNIHLESMHIPEGDIFDGQSSDDIKAKGEDTFRKLKHGFITRAKQIDVIVTEIEKCPYPLIVCGDLNDLPYSYSYQQLRNTLNNSFENKGFGMGTTYNGKIPFLRIDNQFYSDPFSISAFKVHDNIRYSDHFPISARYEMQK